MIPTHPERISIGDKLKIYPRGKKKTYVADYWLDNVHKKQSLKTANRKVAVNRATSLAADLLKGTVRQAPMTTLISESATDYVRSLEIDRARKTTVKYCGILTCFITFLAAQKITRLERVTGRHLDLFRAHRMISRHPKTVYTESVVIKQFFKWARDRKLLVENPLADLRFKKPHRDSKPAPNLNDVNMILAAVKPPIFNWLAILAFTGMRVGELQRLRPEDIDLVGN